MEVGLRKLWSTHPLYQVTSCVQVYEIEYDRLAILMDFDHQYGIRDHYGTGYIELEIDPEVTTCYLLHVHLHRDHRGQGLGWKMYEIAVQVGRLFNCEKLEMTASGQTFRGESRADWLKRRGYSVHDDGKVSIATIPLTECHNDT